MAPKRKSRTAHAPSQQQQSTLSFHGKPNKITKSTSAQETKTSKKDLASLEKSALAIPSPVEPYTAGDGVQEEAKEEAPSPLHAGGSPVEVEDVLGGRAQESSAGDVGDKSSGWEGDEEGQARKVTETQIKRYWRQKEQERLAPRVHQDDISVHEKILREWDMSGQYGPCIGITRLKRWRRANVLGLKPPIEVLAVLLKGMESANATKLQTAHMDKLMSSKFLET